jgi:hypothetical protein
VKRIKDMDEATQKVSSVGVPVSQLGLSGLSVCPALTFWPLAPTPAPVQGEIVCRTVGLGILEQQDVSFNSGSATICEIWVKLFDLLEPQFPQMQNGDCVATQDEWLNGVVFASSGR